MRDSVFVYDYLSEEIKRILHPDEINLINLYANKKGYKIRHFFSKEQRATAFIRGNDDVPFAGVGFINFKDDFNTFSRIMEKIENWFREMGVNKYYAPINFNTWYAYRIVTEYFDNPPFLSETLHPSHYKKLFDKFGFSVVQDYYSYIVNNSAAVINRLKPAYQRVTGKGLSIEEVDGREYIKDIYNIASNAFKGAFLYEDIPLEEFAMLYKPVLDKRVKARIFLAKDRKGVYGFIFTFEYGDTMVLKTIGVREEIRGKYIATALIYYAYGAGLKSGKSKFIHAYMREGISSYRFSKKFGEIYRKYSLYGKKI